MALPDQELIALLADLGSDRLERKENAILRHEGFVRVEQGRRAFVQEMPTVRRVRRIPHGGSGDSSFATEMRRLGLDPKTDLVGTRVARAPAEIAERLGISDDQDVLIRQRHMYASATQCRWRRRTSQST